MRIVKLFVFLAVAAAAVAGIAQPAAQASPAAVSPDGSGVGSGLVTPPPAHGRFDIQLGGSYAPAKSVRIVDRDRRSNPVRGKYNLCYINAFQTQDDERAFWVDHHGDLILKDSDGEYVNDPDWPGEFILDTSTAANRTAIAAIVDNWIDGCARRGYQAIDPDNLDTWTRFPDQLTKADNLALATLITRHAHAAGLAVGQKNAAELGSAGRKSAGFDFAVVESCQVYDECGVYTNVYGAHVLEIEYTDTPRSAFTKACAARGRTASVILRDHDIVARGQAGYHYENC